MGSNPVSKGVTQKARDQAESQLGAMNEERRIQAMQEAQAKFMAQAKAQREEALAQGRARGQELFADGSFGTRAQPLIGEDYATIIQKRKDALSGFSPEEQNAMQSQVMGGINNAQQTQLRQLRGIQGASGLRGAQASAQQQSVLQQGQKQKAEAGQNLFLQNIAARRAALGEFENTINQEQERRQREKLAQLSTEFGYGSLAAAESAGAGQQALGLGRQIAGEKEAAANKGKK